MCNSSFLKYVDFTNSELSVSVYHAFSPQKSMAKIKNAPGGLVPTLRGQILCTGIFHLVPNILIHYNRDRKKVPT